MPCTSRWYIHVASMLLAAAHMLKLARASGCMETCTPRPPLRQHSTHKQATARELTQQGDGGRAIAMHNTPHASRNSFLNRLPSCAAFPIN